MNLYKYSEVFDDFHRAGLSLGEDRVRVVKIIRV